MPTINLALQGGGAHGAFTWGVLDALLADGRLTIEGISGASAGSMNAACVACGLTRGGSEGARELLDRFWRRVAALGLFSPFQPSFLDRFTGNANLDYAPGWVGFDALTRLLSPYQFNPLNLNPLRDVLREVLDFELIRVSEVTKLFISTTDVRAGTLRVFETGAITADVLLASACLPFLHQAVEIDGNWYWDGGFMGNPPLKPLIHSCRATDIVIVQINPIQRPQIPTTPGMIADRLNEISFNSSLLIELQAIGLINRLLADGHLEGARCGLRPMYLHSIGDNAAMAGYSVASKFNTNLSFLLELRDLGVVAAQTWLAEHFADLGQRSSLDPALSGR